ncbi:hypothetical protein [Winogradskyella immobilis]|uniref:Lipocalin-like domain-containing protein n=1 Tax=Winogradskyella immobilis TaxID=2816852 RepID=A0ABS8EPR6_9FLAO|nr:hypothetical protein [Winogradskyella immobilis]MCC1484871.1 hypothetical protein [Winogradskyella immobilis]MCG0016963.1 hypothetical protein [Winogradskyella immobilis]
MGFSLTNIFGKKDTKTKTEDNITAILNDIESEPFGISEHNVLFAGLNELGGYSFFQTVIVGQFHIKTVKGISITLKSESTVMTLKSDTDELESDATSIKGRHITKVDFEIENSDLEQLQNEKTTQIIISDKSQNIVFTRYVALDEEE